MPLSDAAAKKLRTSSVRIFRHELARHSTSNAQIRGTEDAFPMRRELVLDDS
jgi:hypothetical protein